MKAVGQPPGDDDGEDAAGAGGAARASFEEFFRAEYAALVRLMVGTTGRVGVAEELAQDALLAAHRRWSTVRSLDRPELWVRRVAINRAISRHRRVLAEVAALTRVRADTAAAGSDVEPDDDLWRAVRALPRRQAAAIVLSAVSGFTLAEIGEVLGCSAETARTHLRRARERLAHNLGDRRDGR